MRVVEAKRTAPSGDSYPPSPAVPHFLHHGSCAQFSRCPPKFPRDVRQIVGFHRACVGSFFSPTHALIHQTNSTEIDGRFGLSTSKNCLREKRVSIDPGFSRPKRRSFPSFWFDSQDFPPHATASPESPFPRVERCPTPCFHIERCSVLSVSWRSS